MTERERVERISLSLPAGILSNFDQLVEDRGFDSRSQAVSELISRELDRHSSSKGRGFMTGTITIVYEHSRGDLKRKLAEIQNEHINEVISSLHVLLENQHTLEVILVQGKSPTLRKIANRLITCKGVKNGSMTLTTTMMPPIQYPADKESESLTR